MASTVGQPRAINRSDQWVFRAFNIRQEDVNPDEDDDAGNDDPVHGAQLFPANMTEDEMTEFLTTDEVMERTFDNEVPDDADETDGAGTDTNPDDLQIVSNYHTSWQHEPQAAMTLPSGNISAGLLQYIACSSAWKYSVPYFPSNPCLAYLLGLARRTYSEAYCQV